MRVEIELPNGKKVFVGGRPLMSEGDLNNAFPELSKAIREHDSIIEEQQTYTDEELSENEIKRFQNLLGRFRSAQGEICFQICSIFNKNLNHDGFIVDHSTYHEIMEIWNGTYEKKK